MILACVHPAAQTILIGLGILLSGIVLAAMFWRKLRRRLSVSLFVLVGLCLLVLWLGSYSHSPLKFINEQGATLRGFLITRHGRPNEPVASGDIVTMTAGAPMGIRVLSAVPLAGCHWMSLTGGVWDDSDTCDTTYAAPQAEYDVLSVTIEPRCGLSSAHGQIKISILP